MAERYVKANGVELFTESFGDPAEPSILLIMGAGGQGLLWEDELCELLASRRRHVIRFDHRDTGLSTVRPFDEHPYDLTDLAADAVGILDEYGRATAHVVGASMGGAVAQYVALDHRHRVETLTLFGTTPAMRELSTYLPGDPNDTGLRMPDSAEINAAIERMLTTPPENREEHIEFRAQVFTLTAGSAYPQDIERTRRLSTLEFDRATDWEARNNHVVAMERSGPDLRPRLRGLDVPTLVIHGAEDEIVPVEHGRALAETIPGARLLVTDGLGHQMHPDVYPIWVDAIVEHTGG